MTVQSASPQPEPPAASCPDCGANLGGTGACPRCALELALIGASEYEIAHDDVTLIAPDRTPGFERLRDWALPRELGGFELRRVVGRGGMGIVFEAEDRKLSRRVAVKVLPVGREDNAAAREQFAQEMKLAAGLVHPNVVRVFQAHEEDGVPFFVMELIPGGDLGRKVAREGWLGPVAALQAAIQAGEALKAAHEAGLIHRDVKPSNLLRGENGEVKVADFGISLLGTETGSAVASTSSGRAGTARFVSPEQARDASCADVRSDVFSLGKTLAFLLGWMDQDEGATREAQAPRMLREVVARMTAEDPAARHATMAEALAELRRCEDQLSGRSARRRRRLLTLAGLGTAFGLVLGAAVYWWPRVSLFWAAPTLLMDAGGGRLTRGGPFETGATLGYQFSIEQPVELLEIGWLDVPPAGLDHPVQVGLWRQRDHQRVAAATVENEAVRRVDRAGGGTWLFQPLEAPLRLEPGEYVMGGFAGVDETAPTLIQVTPGPSLPGFEMGFGSRSDPAGTELQVPRSRVNGRLGDRWVGPNLWVKPLPYLSLPPYTGVQLNGVQSGIRLPALRVPATRPLTVEARLLMRRRQNNDDRTLVALLGPGVIKIVRRSGSWLTVFDADAQDLQAVVFQDRNHDPEGWLHVAAVWNEKGESWLFINGVPQQKQAVIDYADPPEQIGVKADPGSAIGFNPEGDLRPELAEWFKGRIEGLRISSSARYRAQFEPPDPFEEWTTDGDTMVLYEFRSQDRNDARVIDTGPRGFHGSLEKARRVR